MNSSRADVMCVRGVLSVHTQIDRPAGAGVVVPVMMQRDEHYVLKAYRPAAGEVKPDGTDALLSGVRFSWMP